MCVHQDLGVLTLRDVLLRVDRLIWQRPARTDHSIVRRLTELAPDRSLPRLAIRRVSEVLGYLCPSNQVWTIRCLHSQPWTTKNYGVIDLPVPYSLGGELHPSQLDDNDAEGRKPGPRTRVKKQVTYHRLNILKVIVTTIVKVITEVLATRSPPINSSGNLYYGLPKW